MRQHLMMPQVTPHRTVRLILLAIIFALLVIATPKLASAQESNPSCQFATEFLRVAQVYLASVKNAEAQNTEREMSMIRNRACQGGYDPADPIVYSNGTTAAAPAGDETASWYWPNGRLISSSPYSDTTTVLYPNGAIVSNSFRTIGSTFNYPDGRPISSAAGDPTRPVTDMAGSTLSTGTPDMSVLEAPGILNVEKFLGYILDINSAAGGSTRALMCTKAEIDERINRAVELLQSSQNVLAAQELGRVQMCL